MTSFGQGKIPMAPSTALLFVLYGIVFFLRPGVAWSREADRVAIVSIAAGMPFLQKPFSPTTLARKVREVLDTQ